MKQLFKPIRIILLLSVLTIAGAAGGFVVRHQWAGSKLGDHPPSATGMLSTHSGGVTESGTLELPSADSLNDSQPQNLPKSVVTGSQAETEISASLITETQAAANSLLQGDLLLQEGRAGEAVRHYRHLLTDTTAGSAMTPVHYRLALCAEALGSNEEALAAYQRVTNTSHADLMEELSWLGQARVMVNRGKVPAAQKILRRWILQDNETFSRSLPVSQDALYLLGTISADSALTERSVRIWEDGGLALPRTLFEPSRYLPMSFPSDSREPLDIPVGMQKLHQLRESTPGSTYLQGRLALTSVARVLQQVCEMSAWQLVMTPLAENTIRAHTVQLDFSEKSADLLLDLILSPLDVSWTFDGGKLNVAAESELDETERKKRRRDMGERMLFAALLSSPEHEQTPSTYLLLGNLSFRKGDLPMARRHFEHILQNFPRSSVAAETWFNAAKVAMAERDPDRARQALLGAVDSGRGHPLEPVALLLSGRHALLFDESEKAVRPLVRAVTLATDEDVRALSLLTLASAHLIAGHPEGANIALMEDRRILQQDLYRDRAAFLASLARYRAASTPRKRVRDGRALVISLSLIGPEQWSSLHDHLLTAGAYQEVGLTEMAIPVLEAAVQSAGPSPLRTQVQFRLVELLVERGDAERAQVMLTAMSENSSPEVSSDALLVLADLHNRRRETDRAEKICRDLLQQPLSETQRIAALRLLGGLYAQRGDRERAVLCFSGVAPQLHEATHGLSSERSVKDTSSAIHGSLPGNPVDSEVGP